MKIAHFDCFSGISGDMTVAALIDAGVDAEAIRQGIASLGLPLEVQIEKTRKGGFAATSFHVSAPEEHHHRHLPQVEQIVAKGALTEKQRELALKIFRRLAEAEAAVHGLPMEKVHFHEVGALDSIADIVGAAIGLDLLGVDRFSSRSVPTGSGMVDCAHGRMPIPAPGTAQLLKGVPLAATSIQAELTTPTGAAILTTVVTEWTETPNLSIECIGYGAGTKDFKEQPNLLRILVGKASDPATLTGLLSDQVCVLETNLDDVPGEVVGYCYDLLFQAGALDVYSTPIFMKKNRPGIKLTVLAKPSDVGKIEEILFRETATLGIRRCTVNRHILQRETGEVETPWGPVKGKFCRRDGEGTWFSPEYEDCARLARENGIPLREVLESAAKSQQQ
ncbi:MAG: UPF0272 protein [Gemmatales bacterium]|nr:MAG: UPF0272 protein [Gemmatales bacterium]